MDLWNLMTWYVVKCCCDFQFLCCVTHILGIIKRRPCVLEGMKWRVFFLQLHGNDEQVAWKFCCKLLHQNNETWHVLPVVSHEIRSSFPSIPFHRHSHKIKRHSAVVDVFSTYQRHALDSRLSREAFTAPYIKRRGKACVDAQGTIKQ